jgi:hypothetical protein
MARKTTVITIPDRAGELKFEITELPATKLQKWIGRMLPILGPALRLDNASFANVAAGIQTSEGVVRLIEGLDYDKVEPLLVSLVEQTCKRVVDNLRIDCLWDELDKVMLDISSLVALQYEAIKLNLGFLFGGPGESLSSPGQTSSESIWGKLEKISRRQQA